MLQAAVDQIARTVPEDAQVLDVGGWGAPFNRADWVLDAMPYGSRGPDGHHGTSWERFSARTWLQRDVCDREPWPFADGRFDLVVCVGVLQLVRDPVWVCAELSRVARAGYVEMPAVEAELLEQDGQVGDSSSRWLCDLEGGELVFTHKLGAVHATRELKVAGRFAELLPPEDRRLGLFWEDRLPARERLLAGPEEPAFRRGLAQRLQERFEPTTTELRVKQARDAAQVGLQFARGPGKRAAEQVWDSLRSRGR